MFKTVSEKQKICSYICALLMLFMLYSLTVPYWHYTTIDESEISTQDSANLEKNFHKITIDNSRIQTKEANEKAAASITTESGKASTVANNATSESKAAAKNATGASDLSESLTVTSDLSKKVSDKSVEIFNYQSALEKSAETVESTKVASDKAIETLADNLPAISYESAKNSYLSLQSSIADKEAELAEMLAPGSEATEADINALNETIASLREDEPVKAADLSAKTAELLAVEGASQLFNQDGTVGEGATLTVVNLIDAKLEATLNQSDLSKKISKATEEYDVLVAELELQEEDSATKAAALYDSVAKTLGNNNIKDDIEIIPSTIAMVNPWKTEHVSVFGYLWGCKSNLGFAKWYVENINNEPMLLALGESSHEMEYLEDFPNFKITDLTFNMLAEDDQRKVADKVADEVVIIPIWLLLLLLAGIILCVAKPNIAAFKLVPVAAALLCLMTYIESAPLYNPVFSYGLVYKLHIYLSVATLFFGIVSLGLAVYDRIVKSSNKKNLSKGTLVARVNAIKELGEVNGLKTEEINRNFHLLLSYLNDEIPECRIAATETLAATTREVAITHISHKIDVEKDEKVVKAMRKALVEIRENIKDAE